MRASKALREPREPSPRGLFKRTRDSLGGSIGVICGDARRMNHLPSGTIDLVLTDPPYFDYISYSELGHFFNTVASPFSVDQSPRSGRIPEGADRSDESVT